MIPITPGKARRPTPSAAHSDPVKFWDHYYQTHDETAADLLETISYLGRAKKYDQVEAAIMGFLRHHPKKAEPLVYESLAVALDVNKRGAEKVKTALGYAAFLAKRSRNPEQLTMVADLLYLRKYYDNFEVSVGSQKEQVGVGPLIDMAAEVAPHLPVPPMMSINLALKTKDPDRMADALERLLSLGWPNIDPVLRIQARRSTEALAKSLREDDRSPEAETLLSRLAQSEGRDLLIRLTWTGDADLDLTVQEPLGVTVSHQLRRSVFGGSLVKEGLGKNAEEIYVCPRAFDGDYTIRVDTIYTDEKAPVTAATLEIITHEGLPEEHRETITVSLTKSNKVAVKVTGGRRKAVLPFVAPVTPPPTLAEKPKTPTAPARPSQAAEEALKPTKPSPATTIDPGAGDRREQTKPKGSSGPRTTGPTPGRRTPQ